MGSRWVDVCFCFIQIKAHSTTIVSLGHYRIHNFCIGIGAGKQNKKISEKKG